MSEEELYRKAKKKAEEKIHFYKHLYGFIAANIFFIIINIISGGDLWFYWVTFPWAIILILHFLKVFVFAEKLDDEYKDKMIEKEMEKMRK